MGREAAHYKEPTPKHSRSHRRHQHKHGHESRRHNDEDRGSSSNVKDRNSEYVSQEPVPRVFTWSEPVLDTDSSGRFQYQARLTQDGYQWTISGSESGTNPQYLSPTPTSNMDYPLHTTATSYPLSSYIVHQPIQSELPYYDSSNVGTSPVVPLNDGGSGDYTSEEYNEGETSCDERSTPRRNKSSDGHRKGRGGEQRRHRSRSHHCRHSSHHCRCYDRSKSHDANNRQRHTDRGHSHANSHEKVSDWLYSRRYGD
ncbi:hypothetical protein F5Y07DRAFT_394320 [Xylaria sp. FL0933]|nr:hypothetical protein F5Y07DRAFT_394320 [Xylaria sp. FL0933]